MLECRMTLKLGGLKEKKKKSISDERQEIIYKIDRTSMILEVELTTKVNLPYL
jgi:hypothetical protein